MGKVEDKDIVVEITRTKQTRLLPSGVESGIFETTDVTVSRHGMNKGLTLAHLGRLLQVTFNLGAPADTRISHTGTEGMPTHLSVSFRSMEAARDDDIDGGGPDA